MTTPNATPDLASVLQALASYGQQGQPISQPAQQYQASGADPRQTVPYNAASDPRLNGAYQQPQPYPQHRGGYGAGQAYEPGAPPIDPATITEWPMGLRCVTHMAAQNANFKASVRKMINDQKHHERLWSKGLEEILARQNRRRLEDADPTELAAINDNADVKDYARKVHSAATEMNMVMSKELKGLGVPFFGINPELVNRSGYKNGREGQPTSSISTEQLHLLQRKMVQYLEDMYG